MTQPTNGILKTKLDNGLEVRLKNIHTAPLISSWVWYRVGSRNETPGITGISHWVEHMQFKGTPTFPSGVLDKSISRDGGVWNAFTWIDWTAYFETMPADRIDLALQLESDRMVNSVFDPEEVESERTVIISERQGHENDPSFRLGEEVQAAAYRVHPYHHEVIGDMADLRSISRDDLYRHYQAHYSPGNAVLAMTGDFEPDAMLKKIMEYFGAIDDGESPPVQPRPEPGQAGERRLVVEGLEETPIVELSYHAPLATHPDFLSLTVLNSILAGASSFNPFGGGISNKTSRLYKALVENGLAAAIHSSLAPTIDPYLYTLHATVHAQTDPEEVVRAIDVEIAKAAETLIADADIRRAMKQARALFAYGSESITNQAFWMGYTEMFDAYEWFETYLDRLEEVTAESIQAVAQKYLKPANRIVGIYQPSGSAN